MTLQHQKGTLGKAFQQVVPIIFGYVPVAFAYGVLAQKMGISPLNTVLMSILVYAGSAQLIAVGMIGAMASPVSLVITAFIVNLRHLLMSASLSPYMKTWKKHHMAAFAAEMTDETFALHTVRFGQGHGYQLDTMGETFAINIMAQSSWVFGSILGIFASELIGDIRPFALDYALAAMFIALLAAQLKSGLHVMVAVVSAMTSVGLLLAGEGQWNVIIATLIGASFGLLVTIAAGEIQWIRK